MKDKGSLAPSNRLQCSRATQMLGGSQFFGAKSGNETAYGSQELDRFDPADINRDVRLAVHAS
jgi:hypothetical protein